MKILGHKTAPNFLRIRMFLHEKDIELPFEQENPIDPEYDPSQHIDLTTLYSPPILVLDSGCKIYEVTAICKYLDALEPEPALFGKEPLDEALVEMWLRRLDMYLFDFIVGTSQQLPAWKELNLPKAEECYIMLNDELSRRPYIAGKYFTLADITAFVAIKTLQNSGIALPNNLVSLQEWCKRIDKRPSAECIHLQMSLSVS